MFKVVTMIGAFFLPGAAAAHPGHAASGELGPLHSLADPLHAGLIAVTVLIVLTASRSMLRRRALSIQRQSNRAV